MRFALLLAPLAALPLLGAPPGSGSVRYAEAPPPAHTGGFGEPTCQACHFDNPLNQNGRLAVTGLPDRYVPGETYRLAITLVRSGMASAGYQVGVRFAEGPRAGEQAGELRAVDARSAITTSPAGVLYAHHQHAGTALVAPDSSHWLLDWQAPRDGGRVAIHTAGNAANGDRSEFGDHIFSRADTLRAAAPGVRK